MYVIRGRNFAIFIFASLLNNGQEPGSSGGYALANWSNGPGFDSQWSRKSFLCCGMPLHKPLIITILPSWYDWNTG